MHLHIRYILCFSLFCMSVICFVSCSHTGGEQNKKNNIQSGEIRFAKIGENMAAHGNLTFTGVSGRLSKRETAIKAALDDAARRFSFFHSVGVYSTTRERASSGELLDVKTKYDLYYDTEIEKFLEELEFNPATDVFENNNAVFVTVRAKSNITMPLARGHSFGKDRPFWIKNPPTEIGGFIAGVGFSGRLISHSNTVIKSYENAAIEIIQNINVRITRKHRVHQSNIFGSNIISSSKMTAKGVLKNFYIIESWTDPVKLSVWTLAVAKAE